MQAKLLQMEAEAAKLNEEDNEQNDELKDDGEGSHIGEENVSCFYG